MANSEVVLNSVPVKLKDALYTCILNALSEDSETRRIAEEKIKVMEVVSDYGVYLIEISLRKDALCAVRQMSLMLFKRYIENNWIKINESCNTYQSSDIRNKDQIRRILPHGLKETDRKIRNCFAYCISFIACKDWPNHWPNLFDILNQNLVERNETASLGVIRVFQDIAQEVDNNLICLIVPVIIEQLFCVLYDEVKYSLQVRTEAVYALTLIVNLLCAVNITAKEVMISKLPTLCEIFISNLQSADKSVQDYGYKTNVIKFLTLLVQKISKHIAPFLTSILPTVWAMVMTYGDLYINSVIYDKETIMEAENEEGKLVGFTPLVLSIFDFIHSVVDCSRINRILNDVLPDILYYIMIFMLITKKMDQIWTNDAVRYITENSSDSFDTSIRITARDVLMMICSDFEEDLVVPALCQALNRHTSECTAKESNTVYWWKTHEVCLYTLGLTKDIVIIHFENGRLDFDLRTYLTHWQILPPSMPPLFTGRCTWFGAKYSRILSLQIYNNYVNMTLNYIRSDNPILRICAVRSVIAFCENYTRNPNLHQLKHYFPSIIDGLINIVTASQFHQFVVILALQTINLILMIDKGFMTSMETRIIPLSINLFMKYNHDPEIMDQIKVTVKEYCLIRNCIESVQEKFVPTLTGILNSPKEKVPAGVHVVAMDVLQTIMKFSKIPLNEILIVVAFPAVIKSIMKSDDQLLMQSGGECIRWYLVLGAEKVFNYSDTDGKNGLDYVLQTTNKLLDPVFSENACKRVGRLIITLINKAGPILETRIHMLLRGILSKMQRAENMEVWQSLLIVFAYLFYTEVEAIVSFLTAIPGPTGVSALEFVMNEWLFRESFFIGLYEHTISTIGLCKLLEYGVTTQDIRFENILVRDETDKKDEKGMPEYNLIPVLGKAFKTIVYNLAYHLDQNEPSQGSLFDSDSETITSDYSDYQQCDTELDQYDPFIQDQIFHINLLTYLTDFLHKFKTIPSFESFFALLEPKERQTLASININV